MSKSRWVGLAVLFCLSSCGQRPLEPRDPDPGVPHWTVATFNILDEQATHPATIDAIDALGADIVALQEVTPEAEVVIRDRFATRYPHMVMHPGGAAGIGFLSAFPMIEREFMPGPNGWHPALHVSIETPSGWLEVLNVHLHAPQGKFLTGLKAMADMPAQHEAEMQLFYRQCAKPPLLVLGDFNEDPRGRGVAWLEARGYENILPLFHPGQYTWQGKSVGGQFQQTLDHILYGPGLIPLNAWVAANGVSDHIPVVAHFEAHRWDQN